LLDRKIRWLGTLEDFAGENRSFPIRGSETYAVADEATSEREISELIYRRKAIARCQPDDLVAAVREKWVITHNNAPDMLLSDGRESGVDLPLSLGVALHQPVE